MSRRVVKKFPFSRRILLILCKLDRVLKNITIQLFSLFFGLFPSYSLFFALVSLLFRLPTLPLPSLPLSSFCLVAYPYGLCISSEAGSSRSYLSEPPAFFLSLLALMTLQAYNNPQKLLTPINATKPLKISGFVNVCYKFILVCLY